MLWRRGVAGWIVDGWSCSDTSPKAACTDLIATSQSASNYEQAELVRVLANMAMSNRKEMNA